MYLQEQPERARGGSYRRPVAVTVVGVVVDSQHQLPVSVRGVSLEGGAVVPGPHDVEVVFPASTAAPGGEVDVDLNRTKEAGKSWPHSKWTSFFPFHHTEMTPS